MRDAPPGSRLTLLATDPMARIDVPHLLAETGGALVSFEETDGLLTIVVETPGAPTG
jgi:tRNA 2-thiouridine synthesizing protein A